MRTRLLPGDARELLEVMCRSCQHRTGRHINAKKKASNGMAGEPSRCVLELRSRQRSGLSSRRGKLPCRAAHVVSAARRRSSRASLPDASGRQVISDLR